MIRELRIWWALRPVVDALRGELRMKLSWSLVLQIGGTVTQGLNALGTFADTKDAKFWIASALALVQMIVGVAAHYSNPDGTPARVAWQKEAK